MDSKKYLHWVALAFAIAALVITFINPAYRGGSPGGTADRAIDTVNIGTTPNDGTGDPLRTAFMKVNDVIIMLDSLDMELLTNAEMQALADMHYGVDLADSSGAGAYTYATGYDFNKGIISVQSTGTVVAATGITAAMLHRVMYFNTAAAINISANPQIANGTAGQIITIIGGSDTNTLTLDDTDGLRLSAQAVLGIGDAITLIYEANIADWVEISRSAN